MADPLVDLGLNLSFDCSHVLQRLMKKYAIVLAAARPLGICMHVFSEPMPHESSLSMGSWSKINQPTSKGLQADTEQYTRVKAAMRELALQLRLQVTHTGESTNKSRK